MTQRYRHGWIPIDAVTKDDEAKAKMLSEPDSGFSINAKGESPKDGYMVAFDAKHGGTEKVLDGPVKSTDIAAHRMQSQHLLQDPGNYHGGWVDPADGKVYLDVSRQVPSLADAAKMAAEQHQISIFDVANGASITTKDALKQAVRTSNG